MGVETAGGVTTKLIERNTTILTKTIQLRRLCGQPAIPLIQFFEGDRLSQVVIDLMVQEAEF